MLKPPHTKHACGGFEFIYRPIIEYRVMSVRHYIHHSNRLAGTPAHTASTQFCPVVNNLALVNVAGMKFSRTERCSAE